MRVLALLTGLSAALAGCNAPPSTPAAATKTGDGFPRPGRYGLAIERPEGVERSEDRLDVSTRAEFEKLVARDDGSPCRDREVTIGGGSFRIKMICDAPDGDIHNIGIERFGSYTETSIDITTETILWGNRIRESARYRLREG